MNCQSLRDQRQRRQQIARGLMLAHLRAPILDGAGFFLVADKGADGFGRGMRRIQIERLFGQCRGLPPIGFYKGNRMLDQGIGQNSAGASVVLIQFVGLAQ